MACDEVRAPPPCKQALRVPACHTAGIQEASGTTHCIRYTINMMMQIRYQGARVCRITQISICVAFKDANDSLAEFTRNTRTPYQNAARMQLQTQQQKHEDLFYRGLT